MKESLENKYLDKTITEEELGKYKKSLWMKKGILSGIYLFMMIFSFIYIKRIGVFFNALGGGRFSFYLVAIVIFYITLSLAFGYFLFQIGYMIYSEMKGLDWVALITKLNIKLDIYSFICKGMDEIYLFLIPYVLDWRMEYVRRMAVSGFGCYGIYVMDFYSVSEISEKDKVKDSVSQFNHRLCK